MTIELHLDLVNYPADDIALGIWIDGCDRDCNGCFNFEKSDKAYPDNKEIIISNVNHFIEKFNISKIVLLGGDPLFYQNIELTKYLLENVKADFCLYTGAEIGEIKEKLTPQPNLKFIKGGAYIKAFRVNPLRTLNSIQLATTNQFFLDGNFEIISKHGFIQF